VNAVPPKPCGDFGPAADVAREFDTETAVQRSLRATVVSVAAVAALACSALAVVQGADVHATVQVPWAVLFFGSAQASGVCALLAVLRAVASRREDARIADAALLWRRNGMALSLSLLTLLAAAAAVTGQSSAWRVLVGPSVRSRVQASWSARADCFDARSSTGARGPLPGSRRGGDARRPPECRHHRVGPRASQLFLVTLVSACVAAFAWDQLDHGTRSSSIAVAAVEGLFVVAGFVLLGPALGLHTRLERKGGLRADAGLASAGLVSARAKPTGAPDPHLLRPPRFERPR
jgi:hypothetical protein